MLSQLVLNGIIAGSAYALLALGFGLIYSVTRFFHFAHGGIYTIAAYATFLAVAQLGLSLPVAIVFAIGLSAALGAAIDFSVYRPLRIRKAQSTVFLLASLGLFILIQNSISIMFGDDTKSIRHGLVSEGVSILGARITPIQIVIVAVSVALCFLTWLALHATPMGRVVRAVSNDAELAKVVGVNSDRVIVSVFAIGSVLGGVAAILRSLDSDMTPTIGFEALLMGVVAMIIGGVGSVSGALLGGLFVGLVRNLGVWKLPTEWQDAIVFVVLIAFLLFRPQGFLGRRLRNSAI